ncbi:MAG: hypothetical protein JRJ87_04340 [Deltaproteobacteria bacterium]|nr:hypothetical protein [Deltaproteobacteria bacterium]
MKSILLFSMGCFVFLFHGWASACEAPIPPSIPYSIDPAQQGVDTEAPAALTIESWTVEREENDQQYKPNACGAPGCSPQASIGFKISPLAEDPNQEILGYSVKPTQPYTGSCYSCEGPLTIEDGWIWVTTSYSVDEEISRSYEISAVDLAGNVGPATRVDVLDPATGGCSSGVGGTSSLLGLTILLLFGFRKSRSG